MIPRYVYDQLAYAALRLAKSRHGVTAATGSTGASSVEAQAGQRAHTFWPYTNIDPGGELPGMPQPF